MREFNLDITTVSEKDFRQWYEEMSPVRQEKCRRILKEKEKRLCIAADWLAKNALSKVLQIPMTEIDIKVSPDGKPYLEGNPVYFSISHSGNRVCCVVADTPVGIDVEQIRNISLNCAERICTKNELNYLYSGKNEEEQLYRFFVIWTRKEAFFKAVGTLPRDDKNTEVFIPNNDWVTTTRKEGNYVISVAKWNFVQKNCEKPLTNKYGYAII